MKRPVAALAALTLAWVASPALAQAPTGKVTVVTSFSKDVTDPFKKAFEKAHPGTTLEVQNRNTNAGVKFVEETKANNQVDLFWASAPDAFEVLKGKGLLQKYQPKATGIPEKIGAFPINDPGGFYFGFAASGYGIMWNERYVKANKLPEPKEWQDLAKARLFRPRLDRGALALRHDASDHRDDSAGRRLGQGLAHHQGDGRQFPPGHRALLRRAGGGQFRPGRLRHRHRLLRLLGAGLRLPGEVRLSDRDDDRAGQCRRHRQCAEQGRRRGLRRIPAVARRPGGAARAEHPPPAGQPGRLRQGAGRLSEPLQGPAPRRAW